MSMSGTSYEVITEYTSDFVTFIQGAERKPGDRWMIRGPVEYVPPVEVEVVTKRTAIPLDENEGIYVRNIKTGKVREVTGETYMLNQDEELWEKDLPSAAESLLALEKDPLADRGFRPGKDDPSHGRSRDKTKVVSFRVPHNAAVQIYDYKEKKARYVEDINSVINTYTLCSHKGCHFISDYNARFSLSNL